jgi:hypothetical protein
MISSPWRLPRLHVIIGCAIVAFLPSRSAYPDEPKSEIITVSRETTWVTEPVDEAGFVVYAEAIRARNSQGVTPENNAAILVWKALGPAEIPQEERERFWRSIGIAPLPEEGDYFRIAPVEQIPSGGGSDDFYYHVGVAYATPWSESKYPRVAAWLKENEKPLELIVEASHRPRYFTPRWAERAEDGREPVMMLQLPDLQNLRHVAKALSVRAMLHLEHERVEECHRDLMACFRIARLAAQDGFQIAHLVGIAINGMACTGEEKLAQLGKLTAEQARRFERDIRELPAMPHIAEAIDNFERLSLLDAVTGSARKGSALREQLIGDLKSSQTMDAEELQALDKRRIDYDEVLRIVNRWYDRWVEALRIPDRPARLSATRELHDEIMSMKEHLDPAYLLEPGAVPEDVTKWVARTQIVLLFPIVEQPALAHDRSRVRLLETRLALQLAAYRHEHDRYPGHLADISEHLGEPPTDIFSGNDLIYRPFDLGYTLYSVGENGVDNGGDASDQNPEKDDIGVYDSGRQFRPAPADDNSHYTVFTTEALLSLGVGTLAIACVVYFGLIRRRQRKQ